MEDVRKMRALGFKSEYLEIGYDPEIYCPEGEAYDVPDIIFMGNNYGDSHFPMSKFRREMVEFLQQEYGPRFGVYGSGWKNGNGNFNHSQHEEAKVYRGCKVAINCSHFDCEMYNSDRLLRIMGCGIPCISYDHLGMRNIYGDQCLYFRDLSQLKGCIDIVMHAYENTNMVRNNMFALNTFTFVHQVQNILKLAL